jgi:hypothetical protein
MAKEYTIDSGDSYWEIAEKTYGGDLATINANRKRLQELNGNKRLYAGDKIVLDKVEEPRKSGDTSETRREQGKRSTRPKGDSMTEPKAIRRAPKTSAPDPKGIGGATKRTGQAPKVAPPAGFLKPNDNKAPASIAIKQRLSMTDPKSVSKPDKAKDAENAKAAARKEALQELARDKPSQKSSSADDRRRQLPRGRGSITVNQGR